MTGTPILIVDDESHILNVLALKLKNAGYEVHTASNGEDAIEQYECAHPELIVTDFSMPVMDGVALVRYIRSREDGRDLPIIMLTARGQTVEEDVEGDLRLNALISKPFSPRDVLAKVKLFLKED